MPTLTPAQQTLAHLPTEGQFLVRGAAGAGKTTVARARALHLARQPLLHGLPRVLLLSREPFAPPAHGDRVEATSLLGWALEWLGLPRDAAVLDDAAFEELVAEARELARRRSRSQLLRRPLGFFTSELASMLLALGLDTFDDYRAIEREGRESPLDDDARRVIFGVFEEYRALVDVAGRVDPRAVVRRALARLAADRRPPYDHVVVDDAHLLAPVELKLVRALSAGGSLTLFASLEQRFDPLAASLRSLGLDRLDRTEVLPATQRVPAAILAAALALLRGRGASGDLKAIPPGAIEGPKPRLWLCAGWQAELDALLATVTQARADGRRLADLAIVAPRRATLRLVRELLVRAGVDDGSGAAGGLYQSLEGPAFAAGLAERRHVIVVDVNRGAFPRFPSDLLLHERAGEDALARWRLYLAMTRATEELTLLATTATRSPLLPMKKLHVEEWRARGTPAPPLAPKPD